jgi:DNA-binding transcriptional regulator YdaS (Cro superfamily)
VSILFFAVLHNRKGRIIPTRRDSINPATQINVGRTELRPDASIILPAKKLSATKSKIIEVEIERILR